MQFNYIVGNGYSGTTILNLVLGCSECAFSLGEFKYFEMAKREGLKCDCGEIVPDCSFWRNINVPKQFYNRKVSKYKKVQILLEFLGLKKKRQHFESVEFYEDVLRKAKQHKDIDVNALIDSSKDPFRAMYLSNIGLDINFIHVVKDIRNFAYSSYKRKRFKWRLVLSWLLVNILVAVLFQVKDVTYMRLGHRNFCVKLDKSLDRLEDFANISVNKDTLISNINMEEYHNFAGNILRGSRIEAIYYNDKWKTELPVYLRVILGIFFYIPNKVLIYRDALRR